MNIWAQNYTTVLLISIFLYIAIKLQILLNLKYEKLTPRSKKKPSRNICSILFKNAVLEFTNIAGI